MDSPNYSGWCLNAPTRTDLRNDRSITSQTKNGAKKIISRTTDQKIMKFAVEIHGHQRMNPDYLVVLDLSSGVTISTKCPLVQQKYKISQ